MFDDKRLESLSPVFESTERLVLKLANFDDGPLGEIANYLVGLGGKRVRPWLTIICAAGLGVESDEDVVKIAAGIELIHMATLLHDDIIDNSLIRRHNESPLAKWGRDLTLLSGDFLLTKAFGLCAELDSRIVKATENACVALTQGEAMELEPDLYRQALSLYQEGATKEFFYPLDLPSYLYFNLSIAHKKTASLFELAAFSAGIIASCDDVNLKLLRDFGALLGVAFQVYDDILDVSQSSDILGKQRGTDIREKKPSFINLLWLVESNLAQEVLLTDMTVDEGVLGRALQEISELGIVNRAKKMASDIGAESLACLDKLNLKKDYFEVLRSLTGLVSERQN